MVGGHDIVSLKRGKRGYVRSNNPVVRKRWRSLKFSNKYDNTDRNTHTHAQAHKIYILYFHNISEVSAISNYYLQD